MTELSDKEVLLARILEGEGNDRRRFRASNIRALNDLDDLERGGMLLHSEERYFVSLIVIDDLRAKKITRADQIYYRCAHLLKTIQRLYMHDPGRKFTIDELAKEAELEVPLVQKGLTYLNQAPIFAGYDGSVFECTAIIPKEDVLRYEDLASVISMMRSDQEGRTRPPAGSRTKDQKFRILDSPALLALDLKSRPGALGRAVIYLDLDDFKALNMRLTEVVVDREVLPSFHTMLAECVNGIGYAYAEGGDEFTVLLPNASEEIATDVANAIRSQMQRLRFAAGAKGVQLKASFGIAHTTTGANGPDIHKFANEAKRVAKERGKDQIVLWSNGEFILAT
jgi:diguanylate cyclase (GGDEF)-like protein